jgi:hypothetical protein
MIFITVPKTSAPPDLNPSTDSDNSFFAASAIEVTSGFAGASLVVFRLLIRNFMVPSLTCGFLCFKNSRVSSKQSDKLVEANT